ncbi:unnamed protein product [Alternaria alternata]
MAISGTSSECDLSLTSPSTGEVPKRLATSTPRKKQGSVDPGERTVSSALRRLAPKPFANNEDLLRRRAIHYIQEYSRHSPLKRWLSDADPDKTSGDEAEGHEEHIRPQPNSSTAQSHSMPQSTIRNIRYSINHKPTTHQDPDPNLLFRHLIEHTSLITSLLQLYSHSTDPKGLKNDISMMFQVQNQYVTDWMKAESLDSHKRRKIDGDSTVSLDDCLRPIMTSATRAQNEKDDMLRQVLSANADMWQDEFDRLEPPLKRFQRPGSSY